MRTIVTITVALALGMMPGAEDRQVSWRAALGAAPVYEGFERIAPENSRFVFLGDTQGTSRWEFWRERNDRARTQILAEIVRRQPAFLVHLGDLVFQGSSAKHWEVFDGWHGDVRRNRIPYLPILGNHELYGNNRNALANYFARFPHLKNRRWYSFTYRQIGFLMVDSNFPDPAEERPGSQISWYRSELERFENDGAIRFIIVCCHKPPFTNSKIVWPNSKAQRYFVAPFLEARKTRFFLSGHSHTYERFDVRGKHFVISGGGGAPRHEVEIDPRKRRFRDLYAGPARRAFHFCEVHLADRSLTLEAWHLQPDGRFQRADAVTVE